jgi:hypothetical protein
MKVRREDPVLTSSRREACLVFLIWVAACVYTVGVCYRFGYDRDVATLTYVLGFPDWIFWGVVTPWTVCTVLCYVMAYHVITDDELGEEREEESLTIAGNEQRQGTDHA